MPKLLIKLGAILCLVVGLATLWLPIPTGLVLLGLGLALLLMTSPHAVAWLTWLRRRSSGLDRRLRAAEPYLPERLRRALARTRADPALRDLPLRR